jgi:capsular polysaccharide biosynthesis protein
MVAAPIVCCRIKALTLSKANTEPSIDTLPAAVLMAGAATMLAVPSDDRDNPAHHYAPLKCIGVRTSDDEVAEHGTDVYRHRVTNPVRIADLDVEIAEFEGSAIYGGVMGPQFGHVISQSIGRLWVTEALPPDLPILFANANPGFGQIPGYVTDLFGVLGVTNPLVLVTQPTRVGRLTLAPDLCNLSHRPTADPYFLSWLQRCRPVVRVDPELRIYLSRSRVGPGNGQFLQETLLEDALMAEGFRIIHPETMTILDQIDLYQRARHLIFADGSALHLWSLFATAEQEAGIVLRRPWQRNFKHWFRSFNLAKVQVFDRIIANFTGSGAAGRQPAALLDMEALWRDLGAAGFHGGTRQIVGTAGALEDADFAWDPLSAALLATRPHLTRVGEG